MVITLYDGDYITKFNNGKAEVTDFALTQGAKAYGKNKIGQYYAKKYVKNQNTNPDYWSLNNWFIAGGKKVYKGSEIIQTPEFEDNGNLGICYRPMIVFNIDDSLSTFKNYEEGDNLIIECGYFPQNAIDSNLEIILEDLLFGNKLEYNQDEDFGTYIEWLYKATNKYYSNTQNPDIHIYQYDNRKFVRVINNAESIVLSNRKRYKKNDHVWIEVLPIRWYYKSERLYSEKLLMAGIPFQKYGDNTFTKLYRDILPKLIKESIIWDNDYIYDEKLNTYKLKNSIEDAIELNIPDNIEQITLPKALKRIYKINTENNNLIINFEDDSNLRYIGINAFGHSAVTEINKITIPESINYIRGNAFRNLNCHLEFKTSLFIFDWIGHLYKDELKGVLIDDTLDLKHKKSVKIYDTLIDKNYNYENLYKTFNDIQKKELADIISFLLKDFSLDYDKYFDEYLDKFIKAMENFDSLLSEKAWQSILINKVIDYVFNKKPYLSLKTRFYYYPILKEKLPKFYIEDKLVVTEKKTNVITINKEEFEEKNILEVHEELQKYEIPKIDINNYMSLMEYGDELGKYLLFISNEFGKVIASYNANYDELKELISQYNTLIFKNKIDSTHLEYLDKFITNKLSYYEKTLNELKIINSIMHLYIEKLEIIKKNLEEFNIESSVKKEDVEMLKSVLGDKLGSINTMIINSYQRYEHINDVAAIMYSFKTNLNKIKTVMLPNLIVALNSSDGQTKEMIFKEIDSIFSSIFLGEAKGKSIKKVK